MEPAEAKTAVLACFFSNHRMMMPFFCNSFQPGIVAIKSRSSGIVSELFEASGVLAKYE